MKLSKYKNIANSPFWSSEWSEQETREKLFGESLRSEEDHALVASEEFAKNLKRTPYSLHLINSPSMLTILRECAVPISHHAVEGNTAYPQIVLAPIGPLTEEKIIEITHRINKEQTQKSLNNDNQSYYGGWGSRRSVSLHWDYRTSDEMITELLKSVIVADKDNDYVTGLSYTLSLMVNGHWDEKIPYLYLALNRFLGNGGNSDSTFEEYMKSNAKDVDAEFKTFAGAANQHTSTLNTAWRTNALYPQGANSTKVTKFLGTLTHAEVLALVTKLSAPKTYWHGTVKNQIQVLENTVRSTDENYEKVPRGVVSDMLAEAFMASNKGKGVTMKMLSVMSEVITTYTNGHKESDPNSAAIAKYLHKHADTLSFRELATVLYAASAPSVLITSGSFEEARKLVADLLTNSRDPEVALQFVVSTTLDYDGPVPTALRWEKLIESDRENTELDFSPNITFAVSDTSEKKSVNRATDYIKDVIQRASERSL